MTSSFIIVTLIPYFLIMSLNATDKWASQMIDELLEELARVDKNISSLVKKISDKHPSTRKVLSSKEAEMSIKDSKICEDGLIDAQLQMEDDYDISYQTCEAENIHQEVFGTIFDGKADFQEGDCNKTPFASASGTKLCKEVSVFSDSLYESQNSLDKLTKTLKNIKKKDIESKEVNVTYFDDKDRVTVVYDSGGVKDEKDLLVYNESDLIYANSSQTNEKRSYKTEESYQSLDDQQSNPPDYESEKTLLYNDCVLNSEDEQTKQTSDDLYLECIDQKVRNIGFGKKRDENAGENTQDSASLVDAYYEYFYENYIKEEMEFRRMAKSKSLPESEIYRTSTKDGLVIPHKPRKYDESKHKATKVKPNVGRENKILQNQEDVIYLNRKTVDSATAQPKEVNKYVEEEFEHIEKDTDSADVAKTNDIHTTIYSSNEKTYRDLEINQISKKNSIPLNSKDDSLKISPRKRLKTYPEAIEDPVEAQRIFRIIAMYRNTCRTFENLVLRPVVILIAESIDAVMFIIFLSVSVFYLLYRSINVQRFTDFFQKMEKSSDDQSERKNLTHEKILDSNSLRIDMITSEDTGNNGLRRTESWHNSRSHYHDKDNFLNKNQISVTPEKVSVLNPVCNRTKQTLDDSYEKGSNFWGYLCNEHATVVIRPHEDALVDIMLKNCRLRNANLKNENDTIDIDGKAFGVCDSQIVRNSDENSESKENVSENISALENDAQNISSGGKNIENPPNVIESDTNSSFLADFSIFTDKNCKNILNSTEIDSPDLEIRPRSASNLYKILSPSEINIFDGLCGTYQPTGSSSDECLRNSYNAHSLASIPNKNTWSQNLSFSETTKANISVRPIEDRPDRYKEACKNPSQSHGENFRQNLETNFQQISEYSDSSSHMSEIGDGEIYKCNTLCENSLVYDNPEFFLNASTANTTMCNEVDSLMDHQEIATSDVAAPKRRRKNGRLRRRASDVINYFRRMNLIQIVNRKKKYGKQFVFNDIFQF